MSIPDLETLFTHRDFWGVETAQPVQRAFCRIAEGRPLGDLASDPDVAWMVGGDAALEILTPGGPPPKQLSLYGAVRIGKSDMAACLAFRASQTINLSVVRSHEVPRIPIVSLTMDLGRVTFGHLLGRLQKPALRPLLLDQGADIVTVRHPSGAAVEIKVAAGARAGSSLIARWNGGCVFDEKPRMLGADEGIVNYPDALVSVEGRLLEGAQVIDLGSLWAPWGPAHDDVQERWGKPTRNHVVMRVTGAQANPRWWTPTRLAELAAKSPRAYQTDALGNFASVESAVDEAALDDSFKPRRAFTQISREVGIVDLSGGGETSANDTVAATACWCLLDETDEPQGEWDEALGCTIISTNGVPAKRKPRPPQVPFLLIRNWRSWRGGFGPSLLFDDLIAQIAAHWRARGVTMASGDGYEEHAAVSAFRRNSVTYKPLDWSKSSKEAAAETLSRWWLTRLLWIDGGIEASAIRRECMTVRMQPAASGGWKIGARGNQRDDRWAILLHAAMLEASGSGMFVGGPTAKSGGIIAYDSTGRRYL